MCALCGVSVRDLCVYRTPVCASFLVTSFYIGDVIEIVIFFEVPNLNWENGSRGREGLRRRALGCCGVGAVYERWAKTAFFTCGLCPRNHDTPVVCALFYGLLFVSRKLEIFTHSLYGVPWRHNIIFDDVLKALIRFIVVPIIRCHFVINE